MAKTGAAFAKLFSFFMVTRFDALVKSLILNGAVKSSRSRLAQF